MRTHDLTGHSAHVSGAGFRYLYWAAAVAGGIALSVLAAAILMSHDDLLYRENGALENISLVFWVTSSLVSFAAAFKRGTRDSRIVAVWIGWIAALAAMRELDLHIWLNPKHLGSLGVRYRIDWWLDGDVNFWLKLGWATLFIVALFLTFYAPMKLHRVLAGLLRKGDAFAGLLAVSIMFLVFGFIIDDILRTVQVVSLGTKQLMEETTETIGAALFLFAVVVHWQHPLAKRQVPSAPAPDPE
jgi:hypothetical protein